MARDLGIADRLRAKGLVVVEVDGWQTRGSETFNPVGSVDHHTAGGPNGNQPSLGVCINGRRDLSGPLCNVFIARDNTCHVVAAGRANHAGLPDHGDWNGLTGNSRVYGVEHENTGTGDEPWREDQHDTAARVHAALIEGRADASMVCQHKEWAPSRKIDKHTLAGDEMRVRVASYLGQTAVVAAPAPPPPPEGPRLLRQGVTGPDVREWQEQVNAAIGAGLRTDGIFGPKTTAATIAFQKSRELKPDGVVGPITRTAMAEALTPQPTQPAPPPATPAGPQASEPPYDFPLPEGHWFGPESRDPDNHSGYWAGDRPHIAAIRDRLRERGWKVAAGDRYDDALKAVVAQFQEEATNQGIDLGAIDGLVGARTWPWLWRKPIT